MNKKYFFFAALFFCLIAPVLAATPGNSTVATNSNNATQVSQISVKKDAQPPLDAAGLKEQQLYQAAMAIMPSNNFDAIIQKLQEYINAYPNGIHVAEAHYWLGFIYILKQNHDLDQAESEFKIVTEQYASSKKAPDASESLALVYSRKGNLAKAKEELQQLIKRYPFTLAASVARQELEEMK